MVDCNDTMVYYYHCGIAIVYPEESRVQYKIMDSNNDKPGLKEVAKNKSHIFPHHRVNIKLIILKYKAVIQVNVGNSSG